VHELLQEWSDGMLAHSYSLEASATHDALSSVVAAYTGRALEADDRAAVERNLDRSASGAGEATTMPNSTAARATRVKRIVLCGV
jgi:hypothetical protein